MVKSFEFDTFYKVKVAGKVEIFLLDMKTLLSSASFSTAFTQVWHIEKSMLEND